MGRSRLPLAIVVCSGRGRCGDVPAPAAQRPDRARPGGGRTVLHGLSARPRGGLSRASSGCSGSPGWGSASATLAVLAWRPPRAADRARSGARPLLGGAAVGAGISLLLVVVELPLRAWMRQRALDVGLATQAWPDWAVDVAEVGRHRRGHRGDRRARGRGAHPPLPAQLVGAGRRAGGGVRRRDRSGSTRS